MNKKTFILTLFLNLIFIGIIKLFNLNNTTSYLIGAISYSIYTLIVSRFNFYEKRKS